MKKTNKLLYGALAFAPLLMVILTFVMMGLMFAALFSDLENAHYEAPEDIPYYGAMMLTGICTSAVSIIGIIFFTLHCINNQHITHENRTLWIVGIVIGGVIGMMIYFFKWIMKEDDLNAQKGIG